MWLTGRLTAEFMTIADFREDSGNPTRLICRESMMLCGEVEYFRHAFVAIDSSKHKRVNKGDKNFNKARLTRRLQHIDESIDHYLGRIAGANGPQASVVKRKAWRLEDKIAALNEEMARLEALGGRMLRASD